MQRREIGKLGEEIAGTFLVKRGFTILAKNYFARIGEIDVIAAKDNVIVFCEVKTRTSQSCGAGAEAVNRQKLYKIRTAARIFLAQTNSTFDTISFAVCAVELDIFTRRARVSYYEV